PTPPSGSARRGGRGRCSLALELRVALLQEGADALARVLGAEDGGECLLLGGDAVVEIALVRRALDVLQRERRLARELARPRERRVEQLVVRHQPVHEPVLERLLG